MKRRAEVLIQAKNTSTLAIFWFGLGSLNLGISDSYTLIRNILNLSHVELANVPKNSSKETSRT